MAPLASPAPNLATSTFAAYPVHRTLIPALWIMGNLREKIISSPAGRNAPDTGEDLVPNGLTYGNAQ